MVVFVLAPSDSAACFTPGGMRMSWRRNSSFLPLPRKGEGMRLGGWTPFPYGVTLKAATALVAARLLLPSAALPLVV